MSPSRALLSLDGGGVRALSQLLILGEAMKLYDAENPPKPSEVFDLIGGTGTGGLLALMLGRLRMSVDQCIDMYLQTAPRLWSSRASSKRWINLRARKPLYDSAAFEDTLKYIITDCGLKEDELFAEKNPPCHVCVLAASQSTAQPVVISNYSVPTRSDFGLYNFCRIWEAARATSAAVSFFEPISIGPFKETFLDGSLRINNPVDIIYQEAKALYDFDHESICIVSIGAQRLELKRLAGSGENHFRSILQGIETSVSDEAVRFESRHPDARYFRFKNQQPLEDVHPEEWFNMDPLVSTTRDYTSHPNVRGKLKACVELIQAMKERTESVPETPDVRPSPILYEPPRPPSSESRVDNEFERLELIWPKDSQYAQNTDVDIIAIHGFTGGPVSTWENPTSKLNLLKDLLPIDFKKTSIYSYGHGMRSAYLASDEETENGAKNRLVIFAEQLINELSDQTSRRDVPMIFLCHGIGGILLKSALNYANSRRTLYGHILSNTVHIIFFETPHKGQAPSAIKIIAGGNSPDKIVRDFATDSVVLADVDRSFAEIGPDIGITAFYAQPSRVGNVVSETSLMLGYKTERIVMLSGTTHTSICHFVSAQDSNYRRLKMRIQSILISQAPELAWKVYEGCIRSVDSRILKSELLFAHTVLENVISDLQHMKLSIDKEEKLRNLGLQCRDVLVEIDLLLRQEAIAPRDGVQARGLRINEMEQRRTDLEFRINLFNSFYTNTILSANEMNSRSRDIVLRNQLANIERKLDTLLTLSRQAETAQSGKTDTAASTQDDIMEDL